MAALDTGQLPLSGAIDPSAASTGALARYADPNAMVNSLYNPVGGAMSPAMIRTDGSSGGGALSSPYVQDQSNFSQDMRGTSPLTQLTGLQNQRDQAGAMKQQRIQQAMQILQDTQNGQTTNLPMLAAAGAMLAPTRTGGFSESLGNAFTAAVQPTEMDRNRNLGVAGQMGGLGIQDASVPLDDANADLSDFWRRMQVAEQAGSGAAIADTRTLNTGQLIQGRQNVADTNVAGKQSVADTNSQARTDAAAIAAKARTDAAALRANAPPAAVKLYDYVTKPGTDADGNPTAPMMSPQDAVTFLNPKKTGNDPAGYARAVVAQEKMFSDSNMMAPKASQLTPDQIHQKAIDTVTKTYGSTPSPMAGSSKAPAAPTTPPPAGGATPPSPDSGSTTGRAATDSEVAAAKAAIAKGAPTAAVMARFKQNGIAPPDLGQ